MRGEQRSILLLVLLVVGATILWMRRNTSAGVAMQELADTIVAPVRTSVTSVASQASNTLSDAQEFIDLREENRKLQLEVTQLRATVARQRVAQLENEDLRKSLNYQRDNPGFTLVIARVIGHDSVDLLDTLMLDRGASAGVRVGMAVIANGSLAGRVLSVTTSSAYILPIHSSQSSVSVFAQGPDQTIDGLVTGSEHSHLTMTRIEPNAALNLGDFVITSGLGGGFPRGIPVGEVVSIFTSPTSVFKEALIKPFARTDRLDVVQIIVEQSPGPK